MRSFIVMHQDLFISLLGYVAASLGGALAVSGMQIRGSTAVLAQAATPATASVGGRHTTANSQSSSRVPVEPVTENADRRNRQETISLAREMLAKGTSNERIKRLLPVSDGELILLQKSPRTSTRDMRGLS